MVYVFKSSVNKDTCLALMGIEVGHAGQVGLTHIRWVRLGSNNLTRFKKGSGSGWSAKGRLRY